MKLSRDALVFKALCVLDQACRAATGDAAPPQHGLRLALAFLYAVSNDRPAPALTDRAVFDEFWSLITAYPETLHSSRGRMRSTLARTCFSGICRRVGVQETVELHAALSRAVGKNGSHLENSRRTQMVDR